MANKRIQIHIEAKELEPFLELTVTYTSTVDAIEINTHNRERFALGAVIA
jgi:hypothetical protein